MAVQTAKTWSTRRSTHETPPPVRLRALRRVPLRPRRGLAGRATTADGSRTTTRVAVDTGGAVVTKLPRRRVSVPDRLAS